MRFHACPGMYARVRVQGELTENCKWFSWSWEQKVTKKATPLFFSAKMSFSKFFSTLLFLSHPLLSRFLVSYVSDS